MRRTIPLLLALALSAFTVYAEEKASPALSQLVESSRGAAPDVPEAAGAPIKLAAASRKAGSSGAVMLQGFHWESHQAYPWWGILSSKASAIAAAGVDIVWFPPSSEAQSDESVMAVLQGAERSLTAWWRARQRKSVILARPAYSPLRTAPVAVAESQHDHARPTSPMPRRQAPSPLAEGALIHRLQLDRDDRPKRHDLGVIAEVLWRNRWIGNLTVSPASLKNLLRSRASADAVGNLNTYLACLESLGLVKRRNGSVALCASPRSAAGKRIMAKLALRFPH